MRRIAAALLAWSAFATTSFGPALSQSAFYDASRVDLAAYAPGALIRTQPMQGAPGGASAFRVLYRSTGLADEPIAVSGVVVIPPGPVAAEGRPIVAWAHPTTGLVDQCAPSLARVFFESVQGLSDMVARGYVVAATDYPGLGTAGVHPYLVGVSEARAVLDSVRAARAMPQAQAQARFAVWGHSQGGQAALFTGMEASRYAPELRLVGVAAAAPATELGPLLRADIDTAGGRNLTAMTLWSWSRVYGADMRAVVTPDALPVVDQLANLCIEHFFDIVFRRGPTQALDRSFLTVNDFAEREPWRALLARNTPGAPPLETPIFIAQGTGDDLVRPEITRDYVGKLCAAGDLVRYAPLPDVGHLYAGRDAAPAAIAWIGDRFAGRPAPSDCGRGR